MPALQPPCMRRFWPVLMLAAAVIVAACGLARLRFDTDVLSMLPGHLPEVKGLKARHAAFAREDEAILLVESPGGMPAEEAARSLAVALEKSGVVREARWQPRWTDDPSGLAELVAYLWANGDPAETSALAARLSPENSAATFATALDDVASSLEGEDLAIAAHDPFGFLAQPAISAVLANAVGGNGFASADGSAHLVFLDAPRPIHGYRDAGKWLDEVRLSIAHWKSKSGTGATVVITGESAFSSEIGLAMERDLSGGIAIALGLIALLFWWMQRRLKLLGALVVTLCGVFAIALGMAGWIFGEISIIALASAEILIGLATDYGLVICQEAKLVGHDRRALLRASGKPVICGAITTAVVFSALNLGRFPGMAQLGTIIAIGLLAAAAFMILLYLPFVAKHGADRPAPQGSARFLPHRRASLMITATLLAVSLGILAWKGMPGAEFDSKIMRPRNSAAMAAFERLQEKFPSENPDAIPLIIEAENDTAMLARLNTARDRLNAAKSAGTILDFSLPTGWWPDAANQSANRSILAALSSDAPRLLSAADEAGFTADGTVLGREILNAFANPVFPKSPPAREVMALVSLRHENGGGFAHGTVTPAPQYAPDTPGYARLREMNGNGIWLSDWELLKPALGTMIRSGLARMLAPMGLLLIAMMWLIFRSFRDVVLAIAAMVVSTACLLAVMSACGLKWNFVNLMATPLLLGTGIDYAIHVILTLKRTGGCFRDFWNGTGKALLFCGASNVIGFGSLIISSSDALSSLGITAVIGIVFSVITSLLLLPGWRTMDT
ncbi:MAG: MMPL family transporter [Verrucomicrobiota bacterium]